MGWNDHTGTAGYECPKCGYEDCECPDERINETEYSFSIDYGLDSIGGSGGKDFIFAELEKVLDGYDGSEEATTITVTIHKPKKELVSQ